MDRKFELYKDFMSRMRPRKAHNSTTKYYGVMFHKTRTKNQYAGVLGYQGKVYNLGCFQTEIEAAKAYNIKVKELNLPEYMLNKIEEPTSLTQ